MTSDTQQKAANTKRKPRLQRVLESSVWIVIASYLWIHFDISQALVDPNLHTSPSFILGVLAFSIPSSIFFKHTFQRFVQGKRINYKEWQSEMPTSIQAATIGGMVWFVCFLVAFWHVWHVYTIPIVLLELCGLIALLEALAL